MSVSVIFRLLGWCRVRARVVSRQLRRLTASLRSVAAVDRLFVARAGLENLDARLRRDIGLEAAAGSSSPVTVRAAVEAIRLRVLSRHFAGL